MASPLHGSRIALASGLARTRKSFQWLRVRTRRALRRSTDGWNHLTAGLEIEELWGQFKREASESSRLYKQDVSGRAGKLEKSWRQPFNVFKTLVWSVLKKLSPARRLFLLLTIVLAVLAVTGFHFFFLTEEVEFVAAFAWQVPPGRPCQPDDSSRPASERVPRG